MRTEPRLEPVYPELVDNCFYAAELSYARYLGGKEVGASISQLFFSSSSRLAPHHGTISLLSLCVGWLTARGLGGRR